MEFSPLLTSLFTAMFVGGVAWGATKQALNGTKEKVKEIHTQLTAHIKEEHDADQQTHERLAVVETKVDALTEAIRR